MTFRLYNPFARIRFQLDAIKRLTSELARAESRADTFLKQRDQTTNALNRVHVKLDDTQGKVAELTRRVIQHAQACEAHMEERDILIQAIHAFQDERADLIARLGASFYAGQELAVVVDEYATEIERAHAEVRNQAAEIVAIVAYVKQAEAALALHGIQIVDTPQGPGVTFDALPAPVAA